MRGLAPIGHNLPPDPIDEATAPYSAAILEAANWLDGTTIETESQMVAIDALAKEIREARAALERARKSATAPLYDVWKREVARWKPTEDDLDRIQKGLAAAVDPYKKRLAAEKEAAERTARIQAAALRAAAEEAARKADPTNIEAQRAADEAKAAADEATRRAAAASKDIVKGLRAVTKTVVLDDLGLARWLWLNDREAVLAFNVDRARKLKLNLPGVVETRTERRAV